MSDVFYQVTGVGPQAKDGSVEIFTTLPHPFKVTKEWLDAQGKYPDTGDTLKCDELGELSIANAVKSQAIQEPEAQKKTDGGENSLTGSNRSPHKYRSRPIEINAYEIVGVAKDKNADGSLNIALSNGNNAMANAGMLARITPVVGDYWVVQPDGYVYLNPKDVFLRKYEPITE